MKFLTKIRNSLANVSENIGEGVTRLLGSLGVNPSDVDLDRYADKAQAIAKGVADLARKELDDVPGVPTVAAELVAAAALGAVQAILAGAIEGAKAANKDTV